MQEIVRICAEAEHKGVKGQQCRRQIDAGSTAIEEARYMHKRAYRRNRSMGELSGQESDLIKKWRKKDFIICCCVLVLRRCV